MTDAKESKSIIIHQWDKSMAALGKATTVEEMSTALVFLFEAIKPLIERSTVTDEECDERMRTCPARAMIVGGNTQPAVTALINRSPLLMLVAIFGYIVFQAIKFFGG